MTLRWDAEYLKLMAKYVKMAEKDVFLCPKNGIPHKENINMRCDEAKSKMVEYAKIDCADRRGSGKAFERK